jgi:hypothetical protein
VYRLLACAAAFALSLTFWTFTVDDAGIALRYARNLASGEGAVFSLGQEPPVEGYSSPLWILLEVPLFLARLPDNSALAGAKALGLVFVLLTVAAVPPLARRIGATGSGVTTATALVALVPYAAFWGVSGLETPCYLFLLVASLAMYAADRGSAGTGVLLLALALTRPEGILTAAAILASGPLAGRTTRSTDLAPRHRVLPAIIIVVVGYGLWTVWRWSYYGAPISNSFYAKAMAPAFWHLATRALETVPLVVYLVPLAWPAWRATASGWRRPATTAVLAAVLAQGVFLILPSPEWRPAFRYELPVVVLVMLLAGVGLGEWIERRRTGQPYRRVTAWATTAALLAWVAIPAWSLRPWTATSTAWTELALAQWIRMHAPGAALATYDVGILPYFSGVPRVVDIGAQGLLNPETARRGYDVDAILAAEPDIVLLPPPEDLTHPDDPVARLSSDDRFRNSYAPLATVTVVDDYRLTVYARDTAAVGRDGHEAIQALAESSRHRAPSSRLPERHGFFSATWSPRSP